MTSPRMRPNLIIPGAAKSGTSSLFEYLARHPDIQPAERKEPHIYSGNLRYERRDLRFRELFPASGAGTRYRMEASTSYLVSPLATRRMADDLVEPKLIILLRNPVDRIVSHYRWLRGLGMEWRSLRGAVERDLEDSFDFERRIRGNFRFYFDYSRYGTHVGRFQSAFGRDAVPVVTSEALRAERTSTLRMCTDFLGLSELTDAGPIMSNRTSETRWPVAAAAVWSHAQRYRWPRRAGHLIPILPFGRPIIRRTQERFGQLAPRASDAERAWLAQLLSKEVAKLREATGEAFSEWKDFART